MRSTPQENRITQIAAPVIKDMGFDLVCVKIVGEERGPTVRIMAEDPKTRTLGVDDCARISRAVSAVLDVEDPIGGAYNLEVSSPGIDRLLVREKDFEDYTGFVAKLETAAPNESGQKRFKGVLKGLKDGHITIDTEQGEFTIPLGALVKAKLVLTDELIKTTAQR
ncbi:MAG TPA: ribosome maturation factor RimP [Rhodospirillaceae bacterium]|nr:ribosome maturation factor RimP [Rhodospirillaceae bacterium]